MQSGAQQPPDGAEAMDEVVVRAEDARVRDDAQGQPREQATQAVAGVCADVRGQPVAQRIRKVVDQRDVAEDVAAAPVDAVLLDGIPAIGAEQQQPSAGPQHAGDLSHRSPIIHDVFDHFIGEDGVEAGIGVGQALAGAVDEQAQAEAPGALSRPLTLILEAVAERRVGEEFEHVQAEAGPIVEDAAGRPEAGRQRGTDHGQPAVLAGAPHVTGFAAFGGFA